VLTGAGSAATDVGERSDCQLSNFDSTTGKMGVKGGGSGEILSAHGVLQGPNGVILKVKTIWIRLAEMDQIRFVTLIPDQE
jgi:hypothetical protein